MYFSEFQGGAFDPWGGSSYRACAELTGPVFERVFHAANIAAGSIMQGLHDPRRDELGQARVSGVHMSCDYDAAINESRQLTAKYYQQKLLSYFVGTVSPLDGAVRLAVKQPANGASQLLYYNFGWFSCRVNNTGARSWARQRAPSGCKNCDAALKAQIGLSEKT